MNKTRTTLRGALLSAVALLTLLSGCAQFQPASRLSPELKAVQQQRIVDGSASLASVETADALIRLGNSRLEEHVREGIAAFAAGAESLDILAIETTFAEQLMGLEITARLDGFDTASNAGRFTGDISLSFQDGQLLWWPRFHHFSASTSVAPGTETDASDHAERMLEALNLSMGQDLAESGINVIPMEPMPLGILEVGVQLDDDSGLAAQETIALDGVLTVEGMATLIEADRTSVLLDLNLVPDMPSCPREVRVDRAAFAREIINREPRGAVPPVSDDQTIRYYFTEVSGTTEPTQVVHYWFADGELASVVPLEVQPSARWRTWSARPEDVTALRDWEVIVVETASGCILDTASVTLEQPVLDLAGMAAADADSGLEDYRDAFRSRAGGFPSPTEPRAIAEVSVRRAFLSEAMGKVLRELVVDTRLEMSQRGAVAHQATLDPFAPGEIACAGRQCRPGPECTIDYDECPLVLDTRDCVSCLFRNPLNNRCMNETEDPVCAAARKSRNDRLEAERNACVADLQKRRRDCERLRQREHDACVTETSERLGACEAREAWIAALAQQGGRVADVRAGSRTNGDLEIQFSGFAIDGELETMSMDVGLSANLRLAGTVEFRPEASRGELAACMAQWRGEFDSVAYIPSWQTNLSAELEAGPEFIEGRWPGFSHTLTMSPTPMQSVFLGDPSPMASCHAGLSSRQLSAALTGRDAGFLNGDLLLDIQPLATRIVLVPAHVTFGAQTYVGDARLGPQFLRYVIDRVRD